VSDPSLIDEQTEYYRARASEYDEWFLREGRYDRGEAHRQQWTTELDEVRKVITEAAPLGDLVEIACGTGLWTGELAGAADSLVALGSVEETIEQNRAKHEALGIEYQVADVFSWEPNGRCFDTIFFGFWLSHVPGDRFEAFWESVRVALKPGGRVIFVDSLKTQRSTANDHHPLDDSGVVERRLNSGETYRIVKRFYQPEVLQEQLFQMGWLGEVRPTEEFFLWGVVQREK